MNEGLIPHRYAKALIKAAREKNCEREMYGVMQTLSDSFDKNAGLQKTVTNPFVEPARKISLLKLAAQTENGPTDALFDDFLKLLVKNKRIGFIREIALDYQRQYRQDNNIYLVCITTAAPLPQTEIDKLVALVQDRLPQGSTMQLQTAVDPSLIGGFSISIDNTLIDASVKNQLKQLRSNLISQ